MCGHAPWLLSMTTFSRVKRALLVLVTYGSWFGPGWPLKLKSGQRFHSCTLTDVT